MSDEQPLGVLIEQERAEAVIEALRAEGVYDEKRDPAPSDGETVVVPVTEAPESVDVIDVVRQVAPPSAPTTLEEHLREQGWTDSELDRAPSSWAVVGTVVLVTLPEDCPDETAVGEALLALHGEADTVLSREGINDQQRQPNRRVIAGVGDTETVHTEHGTRYAMDLATVMFAPGNEAERVRMGTAVAASDDRPLSPDHGQPPADPTDALDRSALDNAGANGPQRQREHVFDMFAGIGYFTLPMARAGARVTATEINPQSFRYLVENARMNGVDDRVAPYRANCRDVAAGIDADRVVMGHYDASEYLASAFDAVVSGGLIHYHEVTPEPELWERPIDRLRSAAANVGVSVTAEGRRRVKSYSEGVAHVVVDARIDG